MDTLKLDATVSQEAKIDILQSELTRFLDQCLGAGTPMPLDSECKEYIRISAMKWIPDGRSSIMPLQKGKWRLMWLGAMALATIVRHAAKARLEAGAAKYGFVPEQAETLPACLDGWGFCRYPSGRLWDAFYNKENLVAQRQNDPQTWRKDVLAAVADMVKAMSTSTWSGYSTGTC
ncbi:hypothetical protein MAPG_09796 [Magnaporthiopsis poae ATCC 64411]|uniref:Uncharacterized protein n=1 Tax=Magnaporthiopsis poae (strain ATCC 64411 / 73-15) TaxID=644358 RepID=A0A0C4EAW1_MAGP6|nr:hypothetical protein MAPG_09796 [Magnaporthiopsis poae ATCC 64411]